MSNYTKETLVNLSNNSGEITNNFYTNDNDLITIDHRTGFNLPNQNAPLMAGYGYYTKNTNDFYKSTNLSCSNYYMTQNQNNFYQKENESNSNYLITRNKSFPVPSNLTNGNHRKCVNDSLYASIQNFNTNISVDERFQRKENNEKNPNLQLNQSFNSESSESPTSSSSNEPLQISPNNISNKYDLANPSLSSKEQYNFLVASNKSNSIYQEKTSPSDNNNCDLDENQINQANKRPRSTFPFGKCKVCTDKATGIHYGKATCEGCKGFFKRSTLRKEKYRCFFGSNCPLTPYNRNRCKACRFKKCLEVGMSIQGVKMGRIPKAEKEKAIKNLKVTNGTNLNKEVLDDYSDEYDSSNSDNESPTGPFELEPNGMIYSTSSLNSNQLMFSNEKFGINSEMDKTISNVNFPPVKKSKENENITKLIDTNIQKMSIQTDRINKNNLYHVNNKEIRRDKAKESSDLSKQLVASLKISQNERKESDEQSDTISIVSSTFSSPDLTIVDTLNKSDSKQKHFQDLVLYKPNNKGEKKSLEDFESLTINSNESFSLCGLLKEHTPFQASKIVVNRFHSNAYKLLNPKLDDSYYVISTLLSDKVYQLHIEHHDKVTQLYEKAISLLYRGIKEYEGHDANLRDVWDGLLESIPQCVKCLISFAKEIPGLNEISQKDLTLIINNKLFDYFMIKHAPLFINNESFCMLPNNIQYTRKWMSIVVGDEMVEKMFEFANEFNSLRMTTKEVALMFPFVFTEHDDNFEDAATIKSFNEYYYRAILYEFDLNKRSITFVNRWKKLLSTLPSLNELQSKKIGTLTPISILQNLDEDNQSSFKDLLSKLENIGILRSKNITKTIKKIESKTSNFSKENQKSEA